MEEKAACLLGTAERLKYELDDSRHAEAAREDTIAALQSQVFYEYMIMVSLNVQEVAVARYVS